MQIIINSNRQTHKMSIVKMNLVRLCLKSDIESTENVSCCLCVCVCACQNISMFRYFLALNYEIEIRMLLFSMVHICERCRSEDMEERQLALTLHRYRNCDVVRVALIHQKVNNIEREKIRIPTIYSRWVFVFVVVFYFSFFIFFLSFWFCHYTILCETR